MWSGFTKLTISKEKKTERIRNFKKKQRVVLKRILPFNKIDRIKFYQQKKQQHLMNDSFTYL